MDHLPTSLPAPGKPASSPGERPGTPKQRGSFTKPSVVPKGRGKVVKGGDGRLGIGSLSPMLAQEDGFEGAMVSPVNVGGDHPHPIIQRDALEGFGLMGASEGSSLEVSVWLCEGSKSHRKWQLCYIVLMECCSVSRVTAPQGRNVFIENKGSK